jgi:hypothetical protein
VYKRQQDTLTSSNWCSRLDCSYVIADIGTIIGEDPALLDRAIASATGEAKSILRSRWPDDWPFSSPPDELREAVAVLATARAAMNRTFLGGLEEMVGHLRKEADSRRKWLHTISDGQVQLELPSISTKHVAAAAKAPRGEFGFSV